MIITACSKDEDPSESLIIIVDGFFSENAKMKVKPLVIVNHDVTVNI